MGTTLYLPSIIPELLTDVGMTEYTFAGISGASFERLFANAPFHVMTASYFFDSETENCFFPSITETSIFMPDPSACFFMPEDSVSGRSYIAIL